MFATKDIQDGEIILQEKPLASSQFSWNKSYSYLACDHCMFPLETAETNIRRLTFDPEIQIPHPEADPTIAIQENIISCEHCQVTKYCSSVCLQEAEKKYHRLMCPLLKPNQPFDLINEIWK